MAKADLLQAMRDKANPIAPAPTKQAQRTAAQAQQPPSRNGKRQVAAYFPRTCAEATQALDGRT